MKLNQLYVQKTYLFEMDEQEVNELVKFIPVEEEQVGGIVGSIRKELRYLRMITQDTENPRSIKSIITKE